MPIFRYPLGQLQANCYLLVKEKQCLIIDPADEASFILGEIQRHKLNPLALLATHGHFDHVMAAGEIQLNFRISFYVNKQDLFLINRLSKTAEYFLRYKPDIISPGKIIFLKEGDFTIGNFHFKIISTAGHTPGSCFFYFPHEKTVFSGDTLFNKGVGRYDFSYSNKTKLKKSLKKILKLPEETVVYPGHGEKTIIGDEKNLLLQL